MTSIKRERVPTCTEERWYVRNLNQAREYVSQKFKETEGGG